mmetsp:Transcript_40188/g.78528  ORF Transcript_40188/g.78528 Transcript_40188/m.78528 type:complete len:459 (+) Transcript_40188:210-1586(+)
MVYTTSSTTESATDLSTKIRYYGVRKGKTVNSCIFLFWEDCKEQVEDFVGAEYSAFDDLCAAANFAASLPFVSVEKSAEANVAASVAREVLAGVNGAAGPSSSSSAPSVPTEKNSTAPVVKTPKPRKKRKLSATVDVGNQGGSSRKCDTIWNQNWEEKYERLKIFKEENGNCRMPSGHELYGWTCLQKKQYKLLKEGKPTKLTEDRLKKLTDLGLNLQSRVTNQEAPWEENYEKLKLALEKKENYRKNKKLKRWVATQRENYRLLKQGKATSLNAFRIQKLTDLGLKLIVKENRSVTWEERIEQLREFKVANGHLCVPREHPVLGEFIRLQRTHYKNQTMEGSRVALLTEMGFVFLARKRMKPIDRSEIKSWDERLQELLEFKSKYGHTRVPQKFDDNPRLGRWVNKQRREYKKMKDGKTSMMSSEKALKLFQADFVFSNPGGRGKQWSREVKENVNL